MLSRVFSAKIKSLIGLDWLICKWDHWPLYWQMIRNIKEENFPAKNWIVEKFLLARSRVCWRCWRACNVATRYEIHIQLYMIYPMSKVSREIKRYSNKHIRLHYLLCQRCWRFCTHTWIECLQWLLCYLIRIGLMCNSK